MLTAAQPDVSVACWLELKASYLPSALPKRPVLVASRTKTESLVVPAGLPAVLQLKVGLAL